MTGAVAQAETPTRAACIAEARRVIRAPAVVAARCSFGGVRV